jgi:integrase
MGLGTYAFSSKDVGLTMSAATAQATELRVTLLMKGLDPLVERERKEAARAAACAVAPPLTFREAAIEFAKSKDEGWKAAYAEQWMQPIVRHVFPSMGSKAINKITLDDVLGVLTPIWATRIDTASLIAQRIRAIIDYASVRGWRDRTLANPARWSGMLQHVLAAPRAIKRQRGGKVHQPAMTWKSIPGFWHALSAEEGATAACLRWTILNAVRSKEARLADLALISPDGVWTTDTKTKRRFEVPLSTHALAILEQVKPLVTINDDGTGYLFPGVLNSRSGRERQRLGCPAHPPLGNRAMLALVERMWEEQKETDALSALDWLDPQSHQRVVVHGFRATFRTWATDAAGAPRWLSELALAHTPESETVRAYDRATALEGRRALHQAWGDYVSSGKVKLFREFVSPDLMMRLQDVAR